MQGSIPGTHAEELHGRVLDAIDRARNKQALLWSAILAGVLALPPVVLALPR